MWPALWILQTREYAGREPRQRTNSRAHCLFCFIIANVNKMIRERGDLFSDTQCKVCSAVLISQSQKLTHYQSKKHANKVRRFLSLENENADPVKKPKTSDNVSEKPQLDEKSDANRMWSKLKTSAGLEIITN
uniref:Zinc finger protein 346 n=1 Tax=Xiphophorus couchianus TaxID=32473 RepID=A0A3B5L437_9TELE